MSLIDENRLYENDATDGDPRLRTTGTVSGTIQPSGLTIGGRITEVALTTAWVKAGLSGVALADRNNLTIQNISDNSGVILWNYNNTSGAVGYRISDGGHKSVALTDSIDVYVRMLTGTGKVIFDEVA